ncbi:anoctamin-like protein Os01g0706700 [Selaginella moellendorffii]|uniref:anoctamin-like protein Os01g0706700 n=1 Tax=Selaginella moellendorffii TaxID=88036 RepID=UPI000D1CC786|nr:anoctamin-like protein Os01g0706700 [Selaginella moellendorffii]|eukprot:XP_024533727.1 anoctamin-like protein Os01g0706700 [Selaginella moellendorffii]
MESSDAAPRFEICIAVASSKHSPGSDDDAVASYIKALKNTGLVVEIEEGLDSIRFIKIAAPIEVVGRTAEKLNIKKSTYLGLEVPFVWEKRDAFVRQAISNSLFTWTEKYSCMEYLLYSVANEKDHPVKFTVGESSELELKPGENILAVLKASEVVKDVFVLHDETTRNELLKGWAMNFKGLTSQPVDAIHAYFGAKVAIYFAFLGMYTQWLVIPSIVAAFFYYKESRPWGTALPVVLSVMTVVWSVLFLQFWKRKNAALLTRWGVSLDRSEGPEEAENIDFAAVTNEGGIQAGRIHEMDINKLQKQAFQKKEWLEQLKSARNNAIVIVGIIFVQLPFELAYAHMNKMASYEVLRYFLTVIYLLGIQVFTNLGGKIAVKLTKTEHYGSKEAESDGLIYKVFGIYFMQSYIGLFYHALFHRDFIVLRHFLVQRLIIAQIMSNISENVVPWFSYLYAKHKATKHDEEHKKSDDKKIRSPVEEEYLKPEYSSSVGDDLEDGLFDDFLELALQFGMVTMFACSFPLVFVFALINNLVEIRSDAIKLLLMFRRPRPREAASIGAWLQIFQYMGVVAICTNCALLVCLYDEAGQWNVEPGMAAILVMEHLLLLAKFGFKCFVPEEPAWVKAKRARRSRLQEKYTLQILKDGKHRDL